MIRNSPNLDDKGPLVALVTTPIGNTKDITLRALEYLKEADIIACEDTRNTGLLLSQYQIKPKKLVSLYAQTELKNAKSLLELVQKNNYKLAYCSDAGMPGISDPGALLVQAAYQMGIKVTVLPGASASLSALVISGIDSADFSFFGFLPTKPGTIKSFLKPLVERKETLIFYESPKRVIKTLNIMKEIFGEDREVSLVRELTKIHEEVIHGTFKELALLPDTIKGECVIIVKGFEGKTKEYTEKDITKLLKEGLKAKKPLNSLSKEIAEATGLHKKDIYNLGLKIK